MRKEITIYQPWGGLGDNMAHTVIPELCRKYNIKCYLSNQNAYRNDNIYNFVWKNNPFLDGTKDCSDLTWVNKLRNYERAGMNHIEAIQRYYGFEIEHHYPILYYKPNKIDAYQNKTVLDLSAHSIGRDYDKNRLVKILEELNLDEKTVTITHPNLNYGVTYSKETNFTEQSVLSLEHYSDILYSCKRFITLHSGQACLASTIKNQTKVDLEINVITTGRYLPENNVGYTFKNTTYIKAD